MYVDLYADVNVTEALSLDTKDWNVLFLFPLTDFYVYCVCVVCRVNCRKPVFPIFIKLDLS